MLVRRGGAQRGLLSANIQTWARAPPGVGRGETQGQALCLGLPPPPPPRHAAHPTLPQPLDPLVEPSLCTHPRDLETQECRFLDKEDWGPRRTSKEIGHLQNDCMR